MKHVFALLTIAMVSLTACEDSLDLGEENNSSSNNNELSCAADETQYHETSEDGGTEEYCVKNCTEHEECGDSAICSSNGDVCQVHPYEEFEPEVVRLNTQATRHDDVFNSTDRTTTLIYSDMGGQEACELGERYIPGPAGAEAWFREGQHLVFIDLGASPDSDIRSSEDNVCPQGTFEIDECNPGIRGEGRELVASGGPTSGNNDPQSVPCASYVRVTEEPLSATVNAEPWYLTHQDEVHGVYFSDVIAKSGTVKFTEISETECEVNVDLNFGDGIIERRDFVLIHPDAQNNPSEPPEQICQQQS